VRKLTFFIILFYLAGNSIAQNITINQQTIKEIFRSNANGTTHNYDKSRYDSYSKNEHLEKYDSWYCCNDDNSYDSDTLVLHNHKSYRGICATSKFWLIKKRNRLLIFNLSRQNAVARGKGPPNRFEIKSSNQRTILLVFEGKYLLESFEIIGLKKLKGPHGDQEFQLTLVRIKE
jgi:hypothetical protein